MPLRLKTYILLFIPFFLLFYSEGMALGSLTVSQLWKMPLIGAIIYYLFQYRKKATPSWSQAYYWLAVKNLLNAGLFQNIMGNIQEGMRFLFLPLLYNFFANTALLKTVRKIILVIAQYFILTNIPFLLGMKPLKSGLDYGELVAYSGIFQNQHAMSTIMSICIVIVLHFMKHEWISGRWSKLYNMLLIILASYCMYMGFARTGWLMCLLGVFIIFIPKDLSVKQWIGIATMSCCLLGGFVYMMNTNKTFYNRIVGIDSRTNKKISLSSGRDVFIRNAWDLYCSGNTLELVFGKSMDELKDYEKEKTGMRIYAHNGFANMLATNGALGILFMFICGITLLAFVYQCRDCPSYRLALTMWIMNVSFQLTQGGHIFHVDILYALAYCILQMEFEKDNK
ncbi:MAG: O-antigen ligase family protein [Bacteroidaceae bacterium]|nr:O-antigen ligase family protein [Bacteroidaceae bacterium]